MSSKIIYLIVDEPNFDNFNKALQCVEEIVEAFSNRIFAVQLRSNISESITSRGIESLSTKTSKAGVYLILNESFNALYRSLADGVHLKSSSLNNLKKLKEKNIFKIIGYSAHTFEEVKMASELGADYIFFSPIFSPISKVLSENITIQGIKNLEKAVEIATPTSIFALGGITNNNITECRLAGASGVAVVGHVFKSETPLVAVEKLLKAWD